MKFVKAAPLSRTGITREGRRSTFPQWLRDWLLDNKGSPVLLSCAHTADLQDRGTLLILCGSEQATYCVQCDDWTQVVKPLPMKERVKPPPVSDHPLF